MSIETSAQISAVCGAYSSLFNDDLAGARESLSKDSDSPFHLTALGLVRFLEAALGSEHHEMEDALKILSHASEAASTLASSHKDHGGRNGPALASKVLVTDSLSSQAVIHVFMESYAEMLKAAYKLNKAHGVVTSLSKTLLPKGIKESDTPATIIANLNRSYSSFKAVSNLTPDTIYQLGHKSNGSGSSLWSWGRKKKPELRHASSANALPDLARVKDTNGDVLDPAKLSVASPPPLHRRSNSASNLPAIKSDTLMVPGSAIPLHFSSNPSSRASSIKSGNSDGSLPSIVGGENTVASWNGDPMWTYIISGGIWGRAIFELIFSSLPSKVRKLISWFGFTHSNRAIALNLLEVAALTSDGPHAAFASLTLISFITFYLKLSGWQADKPALIARADKVLTAFEERYPTGSLAAYNRAKLLRAQRDMASVAILEEALTRNSGFRQADGLLIFELAMASLAEDEHQKAAERFLEMRTKSNWSHPTYVFIAAGALMDVHPRTPELEHQITKLFEELATLVGKKRILGSPPATEVFIVRRMEAYRDKHERWVKEGRLKAGSHVWECMRISPASEIAYLWNANGGASPSSLEKQRGKLLALTPPPPFLPSSFANASQSKLDLDTPGEVLIRDLLLGQIYRNQLALKKNHQESSSARKIFQSILDRAKEVGDLKGEDWVVAYTSYEMALTELAEAEEDGEWKKHLAEAEKWLDRVSERGHCDMKNRLEVRCGMLREEIGTKRRMLLL